MLETHITKIEWARLEGQRPRKAGCNARLGEHGRSVRPLMARITTADGSTGFGFCRATPEQLRTLLNRPLHELFDPDHGATTAGLPLDFPLWDLVAKRAGKPVYALAVQMAGRPIPDALRAPCYDTSLYIDDLHLADDADAAELIADEARYGAGQGHTAFKIKIGRGARHMPLEAGTQRDIRVIQAVRAAVGPEATILLDANNGYNLNLAKRVLAATAGCNIFWLEEAFHEDRTLYLDLRMWMETQGLSVLIADGEGQASPTLLDWAQEGVIDVVQYDIFSYGFTPWLALGRQLDAWGVRTAPHHYGGHYGNYAACHLAPVIRNFAFVEWDDATTEGLGTKGYTIEAGEVHVPSTPGFGLELDDDIFRQAVASNGFDCKP